MCIYIYIYIHTYVCIWDVGRLSCIFVWFSCLFARSSRISPEFHQNIRPAEVFALADAAGPSPVVCHAGCVGVAVLLDAAGFALRVVHVPRRTPVAALARPPLAARALAALAQLVGRDRDCVAAAVLRGRAALAVRVADVAIGAGAYCLNKSNKKCCCLIILVSISTPITCVNETMSTIVNINAFDKK